MHLVPAMPLSAFLRRRRMAGEHAVFGGPLNMPRRLLNAAQAALANPNQSQDQEARARRREGRQQMANTLVNAAVANPDMFDLLPVADAEYIEPDVDLGEDPRRRPRAPRRTSSAQMGRFSITSPAGIRAAVIELKPGLYLVAEVAETDLQGFNGPIDMSRRIMNAAKAAIESPNKDREAREERRERRARWEDENTNDYGRKA